MTPAQFNLLRATALLSQVPASGVLRDGVREALAVVDAETARGLNAPRRPFCELAAAMSPESHVHVAENVAQIERDDEEPSHIELTPLADDNWGWVVWYGSGDENKRDADGIAPSLAAALAQVTTAAVGAPRDDMATMRHIRQEHRPLLDALAAQPVDTVVAEVRAEFLTRSEGGIAKYGVTLDRTDLGLREWLVHFREELMDGVLYATRALRDLPNAAPVEPPHAAAPVLAPLAPEPPTAVLGRAGEALAWDGQQPPVHVPFKPGAKHPYGDDAYQMTTDGKARMFPSREAAHRWLAAMGKAPV